MTPHASFVVTESSQVGAARRCAATIAQQHGFDEVAAGRLALVVTELGNNLVLHAREGRLLIAALVLGGEQVVEVISVDRGPGMVDTARCLLDGFSTGGTPGSGLGAVRRLSLAFDMFSGDGHGTVVVSRIAARAGAALPASRAPVQVQVAGLCIAATGETTSGDSWSSRLDDGASGQLIVADGLGHGPDAAQAADAAIDCFARHGELAPKDLLDRVHASLRGTRGAALAVLAFDAEAGELWLCGAGNIAGRVISGTHDRSMMTPHGTAGVQMRSAPALRYDWAPHAVVVLHSDGIVSRWTFAAVPALLGCSAIVIAAWILHHHLRGRDDATVVVLRRAQA